MNDSKKLKKLQQLELKIALEIKRICEKHDLKYFLIAGSLLGAVRHNGFIPWDDDMDIGMLRDNYEKFLEICRDELGEEYYLQTWDNDADYPFSYAKIRLKGTHFIEGFSVESDMHNGIFVDLFPFDNVPDSIYEQKKQGNRYFVYKRILWIKKGLGTNMRHDNLKQRVRFYLFFLFSIFFKYEKAKERFDSIQQKYNNKPTRKVVADGSYEYKKESIRREWVDDLEYITFEGEKFLSFAAKEKYLEHFYGDYMALPPEEDRNRHLRVEIDFGPYT